MAQHFKYHDDWKSAVLTCPKCGWKGTFEQGAVENHAELIDCSCPKCDYFTTPILAIVDYPTMKETKAKYNKLSKEEKDEYNARNKFLKKWKSSCLKADSSLPDLEGASLVITWDFEEKGSDNFTVIKYQDREIWREHAVFEGYERFIDVVKILTKKYGPRLADVVPTSDSSLYLHGDSISSIDTIKKLRESIQAAHRLWISKQKSATND